LRAQENAERLIAEGRVSFSTIAEYTSGSEVENYIKNIISIKQTDLEC
jgi:DNA-binding ferritin-like protein